MYQNIRVEQSYSGTWIVKADSQRFGKDAIMYEDFDKQRADAYAERLETKGII